MGVVLWAMSVCSKGIADLAHSPLPYFPKYIVRNACARVVLEWNLIFCFFHLSKRNHNILHISNIGDILKLHKSLRNFS